MTNGIDKSVQTLVPAVDIIETKNSYIVKLDIPGANKDQIKAQVENNTLLVIAPVTDYLRAEKTADDTKEYRREFSLANDVDVNTINAQFELGVLTITLNKKPQFLPKEITIN
jgi:HSP20 family protein